MVDYSKYESWKVWNFYENDEIKEKVIAEYGELDKIPDDKAAEILEKYTGIEAEVAEWEEEGEIKYISADDFEKETEEKEKEEAELEREWIEDPYARNGVSRSDFF